MNKPTHTPGPWAVHHDPDWNQWSVRSANPDDLAEAPIYYELADRIGGHVHGENFDDYSELQANARLIASAPDLLSALELAADKAAPYCTDAEWQQIVSALRKARGEQV
jgi:hypothetical protein